MTPEERQAEYDRITNTVVLACAKNHPAVVWYAHRDRLTPCPSCLRRADEVTRVEP